MRRCFAALSMTTGRKGDTVRVEDPYNMYYTPDGKYAIVVAARLRLLDFRDPQTLQLVRSLSVPCKASMASPSVCSAT